MSSVRPAATAPSPDHPASTAPPPSPAVAPVAATSPDQHAALVAKGKRDAQGYLDLDWLEMLPPADLEAMKRPPQISHSGSKRLQQGGTFNVITALDGQKVKLAGYVVPLETDDQGLMTEFFFVPFFGACIHVPPPPPNQLVYGRLQRALAVPEIWQPYWLKGTLAARRVSNDTAAAAYSMDGATLELYQ